LLGTAGTLAANAEYFGSEPALIAHADNLTDFDLSAMVSSHLSKPRDKVITMLAFETDVPKTCGILELDEHHAVIGFHEKVDNPPGNLANAAVYIMDKEAICFAVSIPGDVKDISLDVIPHFLGRIQCVKTNGYHRDIGSVESLERAHLEFCTEGFGLYRPVGLEE
ncbi:MAG: sugar phosphate nucleotidyltransferase, partial [Parvibaculum sp.]